MKRIFLPVVISGLVWGCAAPPPAKPPAKPPEVTQPKAEEAVVVPREELIFVEIAANEKLALHHYPPQKHARADAPTVLMLHPFSIPGAAAFDVKGYSWALHLSDLGCDVWALDFRGFGRSSAASIVAGGKPSAAAALRTKDALGDAQHAVAAILSRTRGKQVAVIGYGYGGFVGAMLAAQDPNLVSKLVLVGTALSFKGTPDAIRMTRLPLETKPGVLDRTPPAYRSDNWEGSTEIQWNEMMKGQELADVAALASVKDAFTATDYLEPDRRVRRPLGPALDSLAARSGREPFSYDKIRAATLIIRGELDVFADPQLGKKLKRASRVQEQVVPNATHWLPYERERMQLFLNVDAFLLQP